MGLGIKSRYKLTHLFYGGSLDFDILTSNSFTNKELVTSKNHAFNNGETERLINEGRTSSLASVVVYPKVYAGYDIDLGLGMYAEPKLFISMNLNSIASEDKWRTFNIGFGLTIFRGIK